MADHQITQNVRDSERARLANDKKWADLLDAALCDTGGPLTDDERSWADAVQAPAVQAP